jgi:hypothetical protein
MSRRAIARLAASSEHDSRPDFHAVERGRCAGLAQRAVIDGVEAERSYARVTGAMVSGKSLEAESARRSGSEEVSLS